MASQPAIWFDNFLIESVSSICSLKLRWWLNCLCPYIFLSYTISLISEAIWGTWYWNCWRAHAKGCIIGSGGRDIIFKFQDSSSTCEFLFLHKDALRDYILMGHRLPVVCLFACCVVQTIPANISALARNNNFGKAKWYRWRT